MQDRPTFPKGIEACLACILIRKSGQATFSTVSRLRTRRRLLLYPGQERWYNTIIYIPAQAGSGIRKGGSDHMDLTERTVESKTLFDGVIVTLKVDKAQLPDGKVATREVVEHPGGVAILALDEENNVTLVQQYRYPFHQVLLELPAASWTPGRTTAPLPSGS